MSAILHPVDQIANAKKSIVKRCVLVFPHTPEAPLTVDQNASSVQNVQLIKHVYNKNAKIPALELAD